MGRIMAIDYGGKRCGIAVTDPFRLIATGLTTVETPQLLSFVVGYAKKETLDLVVLGLPYRLDGSLSVIANKIKAFALQLEKSIPGLEIDGMDESGTSLQAVESMVLAGIPKMKRRDRGLIDKVSATLILQRYMQEKGI
ncbi:MAG: Holliday junction resolvase RuvX [Bacteroidetes bacterium]|jgi:putative Holliday junction resolvase|nr:Holliday junction resolvase RuvX [Bacteroidota bacterium]